MDKRYRTPEYIRKQKIYRAVPKNRKRENLTRRKRQHREWLHIKIRMNSDLNFKLVRYYRTALYKILTNKVKSSQFEEFLGCSIEAFRFYIQSKFKPGMTWKNHGQWEIDHKVPLICFNLQIKSQAKKAFYFKNLQPLWKHENQIKGAKVGKI